MKKLIPIFLVCTSLTSCANYMGYGIFGCKAEGNLNDNIRIYPVKKHNEKKIKGFTAYDIKVEEQIDSITWEKIWIEEKELNPINNAILYGYSVENQSFSPTKELEKNSIYTVRFRLRSYWIARAICGCEFKIDENGNVVNLK